MLVKIGCCLGLASCGTQAPLASDKDPHRELADRVNSTPRLAVLFVGNSYSFGVPKTFSKLAAEKGKSVRVGHSTFGGWTLARHAASDPTLRKIREGNWDIIVFQEQSEIPAMRPENVAAAMFPPLRKLVTEARSNGAIPLLYQTWGRRDGDKNIAGDDFHAMSKRLQSGYRAAAENTGCLVVPVGEAWEREYSAGNSERLFIADGSHPSSFGNQVTAETFYQAFFGK